MLETHKSPTAGAPHRQPTIFLQNLARCRNFWRVLTFRYSAASIGLHLAARPAQLAVHQKGCYRS